MAYYVAQNGYIPFQDWFDSLHDFNAQVIINARLNRRRVGNIGKCASLGLGIDEMKIYYGPGYRIYFARAGSKIILLLCGGDKSTQSEDVRTAYRYWQNYKEQRS